ncbi:pyruvate kinase [Desulfuribacillus stibiiarsenatis]|uniref:Pyruvate kinase n=1 Tax=Desulfuribacillus stibiiarsenatis TaxID=1390249 RepID=A0A1E5L3F7_9FIRM|nr:pyruvate kinase [Desulfuribacillus stibiiarsenatis]OEH84469.1 pyruvate kinase [Desulfuribacillus stibiiarsenatis]
MRKTKIVATIGPATDSLETLRGIIKAGINVARLNFSHGSHEEHKRRVELVRKVSQSVNIPVAIMVDTKGPEIRTKEVVDGKVELKSGEMITLVPGDFIGTQEKVAITYDHLAEDLSVGDTILVDDGLIELKVVSIAASEVHCKIINSGILKNKKGINLPGISTQLPSITEKDVQDILFAIENNVEFIAASFIRKALDVLQIREILEKHNSKIQIISKIESTEAVVNIDEIIEVSDGIMVARGDLGVEIPPEQVPLVQKEIIKKCNEAGKPVVTATQMLDSMQRNPRPTRAEASDVANAILDGTDAIMLSGETAAGDYPLQAVSIMAQIAETTENSNIYKNNLRADYQCILPSSVTSAISYAVANVAHELHAKAVVTSTSSGYTARMVSKFRPACQIIAVTPDPLVSRQLLISWGIQPVLGKETHSTDEMFRVAIEAVDHSKYIKSGDLIIITAGVPVGQSGTTNLMKVHIMGEIIGRGTGVGEKSVSGIARVCEVNSTACDEMKEGEILITYATEKDLMPAIEKASAIITEEAGITSHAAIVGISLGIPVIVGVRGILHKVKNGDEITVDASRGVIYSGRANIL